MKKGDSHKKRRRRKPSGETLWNTAAVAGLLLIGLLLGGILGIFLDRQGLLGMPPAPQSALREVPAPPAPKPPHPDPRVVTAAPEIDREALEAQYHEVLRAEREGRTPEAVGNTPSGWQGDAAQRQAALPPIPVPDRGLAGPPLWQQHAVAVAPAQGRPMIAIVLDDVGVNRRGAQKAVALPGPLTLSFMTYARDLPQMTAKAREAGHELMLHVPMEPRSTEMDPGPNVLREDIPRAELLQRLTWGLARFDGYVGINNHMGSRFTASPEGMALVMGELKARGLLFLDSVTAANSIAGQVAAKAEVPYAVRDVFLDNEPDDLAAIHRQLAILEQQARERGYAVGIGHPHDGTVAALQEWIPQMQERGFALVPISAIVRHRQRLAARQTAGAG
ncbi:divergent polysaccharide deacetylase family protein [Pelagibius marinus]|uniref:divergent polysaccharide deacetylase family protein n=1 Tax=Pelagibius marinus TaxID=2762760 RepID=UPI001873040F|nr:divergent polysaccharide deacetylase family protein [Pelagibius marinus]